METNYQEVQDNSTNDSYLYFDDNIAFKGSNLTDNPITAENIISKNKQLLSENNRLKEIIKDLQARLKLLESKYKQNSSDMSDELQNTKNEMIEAKKSHIDSIKSLESKLDEKTKLNSKLQRSHQELKSQIDSFLHSVELRSKKQVSSLIEASSLYDDLYSISESASEKIKNLESANSSLNGQLEETTHLMRDKEIETSKLRKKLKKATKQISQNQIDPEELRKLNEFHEKQLKDAQTIISEQNERIDQMQKHISAVNDYEKNTFNLNQQPKDISKFVSNELYETNMNILQEKIHATEQLLNNKEEAISSLQDTIDSLKEKYVDLEHQLQEANNTIASQGDNYKSLKEKTKQSKQIIQQLRNDLAYKETELAEYDTTIHELQLKINELEAVKQQVLNTNQKFSNAQVQLLRPKESVLQYKETIKLYEDRISELDNLFENQSREISELYEQRKSIISKLIQFNKILTITESTDQELTKTNKILFDENKNLKCEIKNKQDREKDVFNRIVDECIEIIPKDAAFSLQQVGFENNNFNSNGEYYGSVLKEFIYALNESHEKSMKGIQAQIQDNKSDEMIKANTALLEHLQNSCKILKSFAYSSNINNNNSLFNFIYINKVNDEADSNPRTFLLATCARLDKFIQSQKINLPIDEFRPSIFEPRDLNDPQKVAQVFLDFVDPETFSKSPINELFTLFMCVCQINQILFKNIDENKFILQQATRSTQNESTYFKQLTELEKWKSHQTELNDKLKPFLIKFIDHEDQNEQPSQTDFYEFSELVEKVITIFDQKGEFPINSKSEELIQKIEELEAQVDILQREIEESHKKQEDDRQLFCKKANKIVTQVQKRIEANNKQHEEEKAELSSQLEETKKLLDTSKASYESVLNKAQKKLQKRDELINSLRSENESLSQRTTTIQEMLNQSKSQADIDVETIEGLHRQLDEYKKQLELATNQKKLYKKKLEEVEENKMSILSNLRQRSEELSSKYENSISNLEKELNISRKEIEKAHKENAEIEQKKQDLSLLNAKLKMMERTASLKLIAANEALEREKQASEMKQKSIALALKAESDSISADYDKTISQAIDLFNRIMNDEFGISTTSNFSPYSNLNDEEFDGDQKNDENDIGDIATVSRKDCLQALMNDVNEILDTRKTQQFAINDALRLRRLLKMNPGESLIEAYKNLEDESCRIKQEAENMKIKSIDAESASLRIIRENKKLERAAIELAEWTNWSRIMIRHISDVNPPSLNQTAKETRFVLEEALLASINQKSIIKKVEILRFEKKLLLSQKPLVVKTIAQLRVREPIRSIVPLIISFNFTRRMQEISGMLPSKFKAQ